MQIDHAPPHHSTARMTLYVVAALCAAIILFWGLRTAATSPYDDAFITFRYAQNLSQGWGLVYNAGEWVLGTTTPLYAMLLAAAAWFYADVESAGHWISVLAWGVAAWAAMGLLWQSNRPAGAAIAGLLIAVHASLLASLGMETALLVALMLVCASIW